MVEGKGKEKGKKREKREERDRKSRRLRQVERRKCREPSLTVREGIRRSSLCCLQR